MKTSSAQYLLRIDDLCPTVDRTRWREIRGIIERFRIRPILAVVPDNRDPTLQVSPPDPAFWSQMRTVQSEGATVAIHGYRHICSSKGKSILGLHCFSEFAGVCSDLQRDWIRKGKEVLEEQQLQPKLWIAPQHGFDQETLCALRSEGIHWISDGFARFPFNRGGINWLPQQLWSTVAKSRGVWTICIHPNTITVIDLKQLKKFLSAHSNELTSFDQIASRKIVPALSVDEALYQRFQLCRFRLRNTLKSASFNQNIFPILAGSGRISKRSL